MFANVIVDIAHANVDRSFTYRVPEELTSLLVPGMRVIVPFGAKNAKKEGFVASLAETSDAGVPLKSVIRTLEPYPVLLPDQLALAEWVCQSYNCLLVDALRLMIPAELRGGRVKAKVTRSFALTGDASLKEARAALTDAKGRARAPRQLELLALLSQAGRPLTREEISACMPDASTALSALIKKGLIAESGTVTFRRPQSGLTEEKRDIILTDGQERAIARIHTAMDGDGGAFLLHGVTGSGKTEVYLRAIAHCLALGRGAIVLVPEISLTPQTVGRFAARFSGRIAVLHSRLSAGERYDEWRRIRLGRADVVVGARSAVFAPLARLGLIVVDEEHETSYQSETQPRYNAVEVALHRADTARCPLVLGSATPQLMSYYRAERGRYTLLSLPTRVEYRPMPTVEITDMRDEFLSGNNGIFSRRLVKLLDACFSAGRQAMLFLNRRGYSTFVSCRACGYVATCDNCDLSMTYHKLENRLQCHFCGAVKPLPASCPACGKPFIKYFGVGTEQVEEELRRLFPQVTALRMDTDTMRRKGAMQEMLESFAAGRAQALIGTQMIAKGHDFPNVTLVGVVAADATLLIPDYRSTERTFQLLTQVSGRAGRDSSPGRVVVQTYSPQHPAIRFAKAHDYEGFFRYELAERRKALFPPYSLFVRILFSGPDAAQLAQAGEGYAQTLEMELRACLGEAGKADLLLLIASPAPIQKKRGSYRYQVLVKLLRTNRTKGALRLIYDFAARNRTEAFALVEVNPQDMF